MDQDGYPIYRRRNIGKVYIVNGHEVDNRDVIPYNLYLSRLFHCHINVEVCVGLRCVKYIHKYIYKNYDRTTFVLARDDEIRQYLDSQYVGPPKVVWQIFSFPMHEEFPTVVRLAVHLPGMHQVVFSPNGSMDSISSKAKNQWSLLTALFECCTTNPSAREFTYQEFPQHFVWNKSPKIWTPRQRGFAIGRMYFSCPNSGERFYLRLLFTVVRGPQSFEHLRTVNNVAHNTFKYAFVARGLLEDDEEWGQCLQEAVVMQTRYQLRQLFSIILLNCQPINPHSLWERFSANICDDLPQKLRNIFHILNPKETQVKDYGLYLINQNLLESGKALREFPPMPQPRENWSIIVGNLLIWEQHQLRYHNEQACANVNLLNDDQRSAYDVVLDFVSQNKETIFFLNGAIGTGKTFLYNTIVANCRSLGHIVIVVGSSGIASLLLHGGRTAHSTFGIPLDVLEDSICGFNKQSMEGELFKATKLIIWDEVPMQHKFCVKAVDRTLQDVCENTKPFGGITIVFGGDFGQILLVITKGIREEIVAAALR